MSRYRLKEACHEDGVLYEDRHTSSATKKVSPSWTVWPRYRRERTDAAEDREGARHLVLVCVAEREAGADEAVS